MTQAITSGIKITNIRVSNFRALKNIEIPLGDLTVLIGANNAGKTSFLEALYAAIGAGRKQLGQDDIRLETDEALPPIEREATIDVMVQPTDEDGNIIATFPPGSYWTNLWGPGITQSVGDEIHEFMAFRTTLAWSPSRGDYAVERWFLREWRDFSDWLAAPTQDQKINAFQIEPVSLYYIDAKRDLEDDLRRQGSFWRRMTENLGLSPEDVAGFEEALSNINQQIVDKSAILGHLRDNLSDVQSLVTAGAGGIEIAPVARKLRDLSKGVDVTLSNAGAQSFPLARHGMGTRSLASLLVFRAFASWRASQALEAEDHVHAVLALEEPEAHLHPQAQRSLFGQVKSIPGQRIVSTHSPYFAGQAHLADLRLFIKNNGRADVSSLDLSSLDADDIRKLQHAVVNSRGDLLFSRAAVFFEGETEEQALPILAESYWNESVHELGFSFVRVGGAGSYFPFIWLAENLGIPWYIFSDGEEDPVRKLGRALVKAGKPAPAECDNVFVLPDGKNFETNLLADGYLPEIEGALDVAHGKPKYLNDYIGRLNGQPRKRGVIRDYARQGGREAAAADAMREANTQLAEPLATILGSLDDEGRRFPVFIRALFDAISERFQLPKSGD